MSKHQPYKNIDKFLITERALNYILRPVQVRNDNYPYTYSTENMGEEISVTVDRAWTSANHMVLDFIGHELFENEYKKVVAKRNTWRNEFSESLLQNVNKLIEYSAFQIPEELKQYYDKYVEFKKCNDESAALAVLLSQNEFNNDHKDRTECENKRHKADIRVNEIRNELGLSRLDQLNIIHSNMNKSVKAYAVEFKLAKLIDHYNYFFKKRRKEYLLRLVKRTSDVRFTFEYPLKVPVTQEKISQNKTITKIVTTKLEKVPVKNDNLFNLIIQNDLIRVEFTTFLGSVYVHNLLTLNTDWFEEDYLKLNNYASAIYRRFFVTRSGNKTDRLNIKDLVKHLGLMMNSRYPQIINNAFEDIKNAGLIESYKFIINGGKFSKGHIEVVKSSK